MMKVNYNVRNVIITYSIITGNEDIKYILKILSESSIFRSLQDGERTFIYEGYTSNLLDIMDELKMMKECPVEVYKITADMIRVVNRARRKRYRLSWWLFR